MDLIITSINDNHPIKAIKAVRALTGMGLKEAKEVVDQVRGLNAPPQAAIISTTASMSAVADAMAEGMVKYDHISLEPVDIYRLLVDRLRAMPRHLSVQEVLDVLMAVE